MATFALYISLFCTPLETLVNSAETYQKAIAGFKRMDEVLSTAPDIGTKPGATDLQVTAGAVSITTCALATRMLSWARAMAPTDALLSTTWICPSSPGRPSLWLAPSGGGKSTTCSLLPRFL